MVKKEEKTELAVVAPQMSPYELAAYKQIEDLTVEVAQKDLWPDAPEQEVRKAIHIAKARGANPWCDEMFLIPRNERQPDGSYRKRWVIQMAQNYVIKVATSHPACAGWKDGVIVQDANGVVAQLDGSFIPKGWALVGAWFQGYHKGWQVPITKRINVEDYDTGKSTWKKIKSTMLIKVARTQGLREMLPDRLSGMYDSAEMDQMGEVAEIQAEATPPPALPATTAPAANKVKNAPERTDKDDQHLQELIGIIMTLAEGDKDQARELLKSTSIFKGKQNGKEVDIFVDSFRDPRLKGKWLNRLVADLREQNPEIAAAVKAKLDADAEAKAAQAEPAESETVEGEVVEE